MGRGAHPCMGVAGHRRTGSLRASNGASQPQKVRWGGVRTIGQGLHACQVWVPPLSVGALGQVHVQGRIFPVGA